MNQFSIILTIFIASLCLTAKSFAAVYPMPAPGNDLVGEISKVTVKRGDTLSAIAREYGVGMHEILKANPQIKGPQHLRVGQEIIIPGQFVLPEQRKGVVINIPELRLYYFTPDGQYVHTYPVGLGRVEWRTPLADTRVVRKTTSPTWYVPKSIREYTYETRGEILPEFIPPGPKNPLGDYAMYLGVSGYLIHGTNDPATIGNYVSSGCIRMRNEDIGSIYPMIDINTPVHIVHNPYKAGWQNGNLYLESHATVDYDLPPSALNQIYMEDVVNAAMMRHSAANQVDWDSAYQVANNQRGVPILIGQETP